ILASRRWPSLSRSAGAGRRKIHGDILKCFPDLARPIQAIPAPAFSLASLINVHNSLTVQLRCPAPAFSDLRKNRGPGKSFAYFCSVPGFLPFFSLCPSLEKQSFLP